MQEQVDAYLEQLKRGQQHRPLTISAYQQDLKRLTLYLLSKKISLNEVHTQTIRHAIQSMRPLNPRTKAYTGTSLARMLVCWRHFFAYLVSSKQLPINPCIMVRSPRKEKKLPETLSPDGMYQLLTPALSGTAENPHSHKKTEEWIICRDLAMFELLYSSGLRVSELAALTLEALNLQTNDVWIFEGKGGKQRIVPVGQPAHIALTNWLALRQSIAQTDCQALFVNQKGVALGIRSIQLRLAKWGTQQSIMQNMHPHMLRHAFASHILQSSGDLRAVQELLGHSSIVSTQIYTQLDFQHLAKVYDNAHPRAKKKP